MFIHKLKPFLNIYRGVVHQNSILSSTKFTRKQHYSIVTGSAGKPSINLLEKIKKDCIINARVNSMLVKEILTTTNVTELTKNDQLFLLEICDNRMPDRTPLERMEIFQQIWTSLGDVRTTVDYVKTYLNVHCANRAPIVDGQIEFKPTIDIYQDLIAAHCEVGNVEKALEILVDMKENQIPITENIFNSLIVGHARRNDIAEAENTIDTMVPAGIMPSTETYTKLLGAMIETGEMRKVNQIFKENQNAFTISQVFYLIRVASMSSKPDGLQLLPNLIGLLSNPTKNDPNINPNVQNLLIELTREHRYDAILGIIRELPKIEFLPNQSIDQYGGFLINEYLKTNAELEHVLTLCQSLIACGKNPRALHVACEISLRRDNTERSIALLTELAKTETLRCHYFWPIMMTKFKVYGESGIIETIKVMKSCGVLIDFETLTAYVFPKLSLNLTNPERLISVLQENGVQISELLNPTIVYLVNQGRIGDAIHVVKSHKASVDSDVILPYLIHQTIKSRTPQKLTKLIGILAERNRKTGNDFAGRYLFEVSCSSKINFKEFGYIVREFSKEKIEISGFAVHQITQNLEKCTDQSLAKQIGETLKGLIDRKLRMEKDETTTFDDDSGRGGMRQDIPHPREMTFDQLQCHLVELESKNLNTRGVLRRLLQLAVREDKLQLAVEYRAKCEKLKVNLSPGMLASLFELNIRLKNVEQADADLKTLRSTYPGFMVDDHKLLDFATILVERVNLKGAKAILKSQPQVKGGQAVQKNVWNLLTAVANLQLDKTENFLEFLVKEGYCNLQNNIVLGPVIRESLMKKDLKRAVEQYKKFVTKYRKTPLQLELFTILLHVSNGNSNDENNCDYNMTPEEAKTELESVINLTSTVHGASNTHLTLSVALADAGTENQLRKFLINPEIKIDREQFVKQCEHMSEMDKIPSLIKLAKCSRGLGNLLPENEIYKIVMMNFDRANKCDEAISFFDNLIDDPEFKMTQEFSRILMNLLGRNNYEIPTRVMMYSK